MKLFPYYNVQWPTAPVVSDGVFTVKYKWKHTDPTLSRLCLFTYEFVKPPISLYRVTPGDLVKNACVLENWPRFRGCTPKPTLLHEFTQFLVVTPPPLTTTTLLKPASLHEFTQVCGMWCTSSPPPLFTDLHTFYALIGCAPPHPLWVRPCLHYDLIFIAAVTQWNPMGTEQIIS